MIDTNFLLRKPCLVKVQAPPNEIICQNLGCWPQNAERLKNKMLIARKDLFLLSIRAFYFRLDKNLDIIL